MWAFVCDDDGTVNPSSTKNAVSSLRAAGADPIFTDYATGNHGGSWTRAYDANTPLVPWIMAQRRGQLNFSSVLRVSTTSPTLTSTYVTKTTPVVFTGITEDVTAAVTSVGWINLSTNATGTATGTNSWTTGGIPLQANSNLVRFMATGAAYGSLGNGNTTFSRTEYVCYSSVTDSTSPFVAITAPVSGSSYAVTSPLVNLAGTASDNLGVTRVSWVNDRGGTGTATGNVTWSATEIDLKLGANVITITAQDASGNSASTSLTVTYSTTVSNQPPVVNASNDQYVVLPATASLVGTVTDDGVAPSRVPVVTWSKISGPDTVTFSSPNAANTTATFNAAGIYVLRLSGDDGTLASSDDVTVTVFSAGAGYHTLKFDMGGSGSYTTSGNWNNITDSLVGKKITNAIDTNGLGTGIDLSIIGAFAGTNMAGSTAAGVYPVTAMQDSFFVQNTAVANFNLEGLSLSSKYSLTFFASRVGDGTGTNRVTSYTVGATSVTLNATDNTSKVATIPGVSPNANGTIPIQVANSIGSGYGYLGVLEVQVVSPSAVDTWRNTIFGADASDPAIGGDFADPDGDDIPNLMEYALVGNPKAATTSILPKLIRQGQQLQISFVRIAPTDVTYVVESSIDLIGWTPVSTLLANATAWTGTGVVTETGTGATRNVTVQDSGSIEPGARRYLRLNVYTP